MTVMVQEPLRESIEPARQEALRHFGVHPYFTRRAWNVVQGYIKHFSAPGDTVLDPFGGSGVTATESLVLRRKAIYVDIGEWACFLARQTAIAPVDLAGLSEAFAGIERQVRPYLESLWSRKPGEVEKEPVRDWYPKGVQLPSNADVRFVEELFTPRMLRGLARLRGAIMEVEDQTIRELLLFAFSSTLARINRTFLSAANRKESRGGSAIFSIYRYKVAKNVVELPLWEQFATRFKRVFEAKRQTNQLIGSFYRDGDTAQYRYGSATELDWIGPETVDYIYTDPPYGAHISYLDLSTMWAAWLGFHISVKDRVEEVIEGGEMRKSRETYQHLLAVSLGQMHRTLKQGGWLSIVFVHRDMSYWESIVEACRQAGLEYVNTVVQPAGVVWSMHKKKNPLRVLSGELVLNFCKSARRAKSRSSPGKLDAVSAVRECCEREILLNCGASTEDLHHAVVPDLLEKGLLGEFCKDHGDLTPVLQGFFDFDASTNCWHLRPRHSMAGKGAAATLAKYHIVRFLAQRAREGQSPTETQVHEYLTRLEGNGRRGATWVRRLLREVAYSPDSRHWQPLKPGQQRAFHFTA